MEGKRKGHHLKKHSETVDSYGKYGKIWTKYGKVWKHVGKIKKKYWESMDFPVFERI